MTPEPSRPSLLRAWGLRFAVVYWVFYCLADLVESWQQLLHAAVPWAATHLLGWPAITLFPNGSGDTTYNYAEVLCFLAAATIVATPWTLLDRRRQHDQRLRAGLRLLLRYFLAMVLFSYGWSKVFRLQFSSPSLSALMEPYGESTPMHLLWTFMGYSAPYTVFAGALEVVAACFLLFRRTTTLGGLLSAAVMSNVVMLNFCYDVPVKLYSSHLLLISMVLVLPDARRLVDMLILNRSTASAIEGPPAGWLRRIVKVAAIAYIGGYEGWQAWQSHLTHGDNIPEPPLYGLYNVSSYAADGKTRPPLATDPWRWRYVTFERRGLLKLQTMAGSAEVYKVAVDEAHGQLTLSSREGVNDPATLAYHKLPDGDLLLDGTLRNEHLVVQLHPRDLNSLALVGRGFHWINEHPLNY